MGFYLEGSICNKQAIGSRIEVLDSYDNLHTDQVTGGNGYATQGSPLVHFGLGDALIEDIKIIWTDGMQQNVDISAVNQYYYIHQGELPKSFFSTTPTGDVFALENYFNVFPNPAQDHVEIEFISDEEDAATITIRDMLGNIILYREINLSEHNKTQIQLSTEDLKSSIYLISIHIGNHSFTKKLLITH